MIELLMIIAVALLVLYVIRTLPIADPFIRTALSVIFVFIIIAMIAGWGGYFNG